MTSLYDLAATVQDFLERYEVGETVGVGGELCCSGRSQRASEWQPAVSDSCVWSQALRW